MLSKRSRADDESEKHKRQEIFSHDGKHFNFIFLLISKKGLVGNKVTFFQLNNVNNHIAMMDVSSPFVEEHDSSSQPASIIHNPLTHSIT